MVQKIDGAKVKGPFDKLYWKGEMRTSSRQIFFQN